MHKYFAHSLITLTGLLTSPLVNASTAAPSIPEPSVLGLLAIGGVAGAIVAIRKRRK